MVANLELEKAEEQDRGDICLPPCVICICGRQFEWHSDKGDIHAKGVVKEVHATPIGIKVEFEIESQPTDEVKVAVGDLIGDLLRLPLIVGYESGLWNELDDKTTVLSSQAEFPEFYGKIVFY